MVGFAVARRCTQGALSTKSRLLEALSTALVTFLENADLTEATHHLLEAATEVTGSTAAFAVGVGADGQPRLVAHQG